MSNRQFRGPASTVPHFAASNTLIKNAEWVAVDIALDSVLRASGSSLCYYSMPSTLQAMRESMLKIMKYSYIKGSNDHHDSLNKFL